MHLRLLLLGFLGKDIHPGFSLPLNQKTYEALIRLQIKPDRLAGPVFFHELIDLNRHQPWGITIPCSILNRIQPRPTSFGQTGILFASSSPGDPFPAFFAYDGQ